MKNECLSSEPTSFDPEWSTAQNGGRAPDLRLDFILVSKAVSDTAHGTLFAGIETSNITRYASDHFPIAAHWTERKRYNM